MLRKEKRSAVQAAEEAKAQRNSAMAEARRLSTEVEELKAEFAKSHTGSDGGKQECTNGTTDTVNSQKTDGSQLSTAQCNVAGNGVADRLLTEAHERAAAADRRAEARDRDVEKLRKELEDAREDARRALAKAKLAQDAKPSGGSSETEAKPSDVQAMRAKLQESMKVRARLREAKQQAEQNLKELQQKFDRLNRATKPQ